MKRTLLAFATLSALSTLSHAQLTCDIGSINSWNSGFTINDIIVSNTSNQTVDDWSVDIIFENSVGIVNTWSAELDSSAGTQFTATGVSYNATLGSGQQASFGFQGTHGGTLGDVRCETGDVVSTPTPQPTPTVTPTPTTSPGNSITLPGRLQVEDYASYNDSTEGNSGEAYRSDDVDIQVTSDAGGGYNVGWIASGEWLSFPVEVTQAGRYQVTMRVASLSAGGQISLQLDGLPIAPMSSFEATGGWQNWRNLSFEANLEAGSADLRVNFLSSAFNVNYIDFTWLGDPTTPTPTPTPTPTATPTSTPTPTSPPTPTVTPVPTTPPSGTNHDDWLSTEGNRIVDRDGNPVWLTGTNWFGFNTGTNAFDGLWSANLEQAMGEMADRGINFLRVPISTELVWQWANGDFPLPSSINNFVNPDLEGLNSLEIFDRFLAVSKAEGMKVMLDFHSAKTNAVGHLKPMWYDGEITTEIFYDSWVWLAERYKNDDTILAFDLENEPHGNPLQNGPFARWDGSDHPDNWKAVAEEASRRILAVHPNILIMVEGIEATPVAGATYASRDEDDYDFNWWGGNLRGVKDHPVDLGAFQNKLVYSPHDYGPLVFAQPWFEKDFNKETLYEDVWRDNWAFIMEDDIAPLLIGEWGGFMDGGDNQKWMEAIRDYIVENSIHHTFWCFNANSGDTGGLVESDFVTWDEAKYALMEPTLWQTPNGRYVGLDHQIPLGGSNGITVTEYYNQGYPAPVR